MHASAVCCSMYCAEYPRTRRSADIRAKLMALYTSQQPETYSFNSNKPEGWKQRCIESKPPTLLCEQKEPGFANLIQVVCAWVHALRFHIVECDTAYPLQISMQCIK